MTRRQTGRIVAFDAIRAISILWIVAVWHMFDYFPAYTALKGGVTYRITVGLLGSFVLISGFLMGRKPIAAADFYRARFARIYPPFFLACLAFGAIGLGSWQTMVKGAALIGMFAGPAPFTLWFINMIVLFYAVTPVLMRLRTGLAGYICLCGVVELWLCLMPIWLTGMSPRLAMYFPCYALGLLLARDDSPAARSCLIGGLLVLVPGFAMTTLVEASSLENNLHSALWASGAALTLFGGAQMAEASLAGSRWPEPIAYASYFLYLFHRIVYALALKPFTHASNGVRLAVLLAVGLPLALMLAWFGQTSYDSLWSRSAFRRSTRQPN